MKKNKIVLVLGAALMLGGCGNATANISHGSDVIGTIGNTSITDGDIYSSLKSTSGYSYALTMIREQIFAREIEVTDEMRQQAQDEYDQYAEQYEAQDTGMTAEEYVIYLGYESVDDYINKVYLPNYEQQALNAKYMDDDNANFLEEYEPVKAQIIQTSDQDTASQALEALNNGDDFADVAEEYNDSTTYDGSEQIVTTQSGLPTAVMTKLNDAEDGTLVNEVIADTTNGYYYVVRLVSKDYETIKDDIVEALQDNTTLTNDAMVYYLKKYNFTVYDVDIFNALRDSNPEYLVQRPELAEEAESDSTTATN
ncbi:MAG TPA: peptidyl-prolyl cis-trans isomerase [Candidatus Merdibacter merdavium]|uniref:peptidylprolyl isomerase n=1 Tax=Candidatus Merdibacter merdavium TaxID=2838692 RepID=A0A9D2NS63_9FIRM|nr:peptidyl-prolyl cis-trans isomerase [Candidatus Merdibacter merdavium]